MRMAEYTSGKWKEKEFTQQIALPMPADGAVLNFSGPFRNGDCINDLTTVLSTNTRMPRAAHAPLQRQMSISSFFNTPRAGMNRLQYMVSWDAHMLGSRESSYPNGYRSCGHS